MYENKSCINARTEYKHKLYYIEINIKHMYAHLFAENIAFYLSFIKITKALILYNHTWHWKILQTAKHQIYTTIFNVNKMYSAHILLSL